MSSISSASYVSNVASHLQQLSASRQQQVEIDLQVGESTRRARDQAVERAMQDNSKQAERVAELKKAALQSQGGGIDVWA